MSANPHYLTGQFIASMPELSDPNFDHTITYILEHNEQGAFGITLNRPGDYPVADILEQLELQTQVPELMEGQALQGGPVQTDMVFILHPASERDKWESSLDNGHLVVTSSPDVLEAIARGEGPEKWLIVLGYSGWGPGQLEREMMENAWLSTPAFEEIIFDTVAENKWKALAQKTGIDLDLIQKGSGHA